MCRYPHDIYYLDRCRKDEATAKNFVWCKSSSHSQEKLEKPVGGGLGGGHPSPLLAIGGLSM